MQIEMYIRVSKRYIRCVSGNACMNKNETQTRSNRTAHRGPGSSRGETPIDIDDILDVGNMS